MTLDAPILALDLGRARTGVARMHPIARLPEPLSPIDMSDAFVTDVTRLVAEHDCAVCVVGIPMGLQGVATEQSAWCEQQADMLRASLAVPVFTVPEDGTTKEAERIARTMTGSSTSGHTSIDSIAAGIIAQDFMEQVVAGKVKGLDV